MYCNIKRNIEIVRASWQMCYKMVWKCIPRFNGENDQEEERENEVFEIFEEELLFEDGRPAGVKVEDHIFLFDAPDTHEYEKTEYLGYKRGAGDIYETHIYRLIRKG